MATLGSFGDIVFEVSTKKVLTFNEFERTNSPRWNMHNTLQNKPQAEFEGPGSDEISFSILLKSELGVNPEKEAAKLRTFADTGKKAPFIRGNKPISTNMWAIQKVTEIHRNIDNLGNVLTIQLQIDLLEYANNTSIVQKKTTTNSNSSTKTGFLGTITITVKSVHIRSGPSAKHKVLGYAMRQKKLAVKSVSNGWYSLGGGKYITANSKYSTLKKG